MGFGAGIFVVLVFAIGIIVGKRSVQPPPPEGEPPEVVQASLERVNPAQPEAEKRSEYYDLLGWNEEAGIELGGFAASDEVEAALDWAQALGKVNLEGEGWDTKVRIIRGDDRVDRSFLGDDPGGGIPAQHKARVERQWKNFREGRYLDL